MKRFREVQTLDGICSLQRHYEEWRPLNVGFGGCCQGIQAPLATAYLFPMFKRKEKKKTN